MNKPRRIMLLEANRYRALLIQRALEQGATVSIVARFTDPQQALEELNQTSYAAVIVDIDTFPDLWQRFCQQSLQRDPESHFIALTGDSADRDQDWLTFPSPVEDFHRSPRCHLVRFDESGGVPAMLSSFSQLPPYYSDRQTVNLGATARSGLVVTGQ